MSLKEQLLKAGLVTKKQANQAESAQKRLEHQSKKNKELADKLAAEKKQTEQMIDEETEARKQLDRELNRKRDQAIAEREKIFRSKQIINANSTNSRSATEYYFFQEDKYVRKVLVTPMQREMLARGKLGITRPEIDVDEFILVPLESAKILQEICLAKVLVLHDEIDNSIELDSNF